MKHGRHMSLCPIRRHLYGIWASQMGRKMGTMAYTGHIPQCNGFHDLWNGHVDSCTMEMWFLKQWLGEPDPRRSV